MPIGYYLAKDIFPEKLCREVFSQLGQSMKVTFAQSGSPLNLSEKRIAEPLVHKIRAYLDKKGITTRRIVWFGKQSSKYGHVDVAKELLELGYPLATVALAMGFSFVTLYRWGLNGELRDSKLPELYLDKETAIAIGKARLAQVDKPSYGKGVIRKDNTLALLGQCVVALEAIREREKNKDA